MVIVILSLISLIVYLLTSAGNTPYNHFILLADAFLKGNFYVEGIYPWIEKVPINETQFFVANPPMPAILALPFVTIFGKGFPQQLLAHLLGVGIVFLTYKLALGIKKDKILALWSALLIGFGSIIWFLASVGSVWYLGQLSATFLLLLALVLAQRKKSPFFAGLALGAAYLSRLHTILSLPFFIYLVVHKKSIKNIIPLLTGIAPFILFNCFYNLSRFGVIWDRAYLLIPGVTTEPWYQKGLLHYSYIPSHLEIIFGALPIFSKLPPFIQPSWKGMAIWLTTPAFVWAFLAPLKERVVQLSWMAIFLISLVIFTHGSTGFAQFGYRFAVDFYPFLMLLTIKGIAKTNLRWHHWLLLILSILVNLWGVLWINKFGWVSY